MSCQPNCALYLLVPFVVEPGTVQQSFPSWTHLLTYSSLSLNNHRISKHELNSYNVQNIWQGLMEGRKSPFVQASESWIERETVNSISLLHLNKINGGKNEWGVRRILTPLHLLFIKADIETPFTVRIWSSWRTQKQANSSIGSTEPGEGFL